MKSIVFLLVCSPIMAVAQEKDSTTELLQKFREIEQALADSYVDNTHYFNVNYGYLGDFQLAYDFMKPENWVKQDLENKENERYGGNIFEHNYTTEQILTVLTQATDFELIESAKSNCIENYSEIFPHLVGMLSNKTFVGLTNTADLMIPGRNLKFQGHGGMISYDLFTVAGRASWILHEITGEDFSNVDTHLTEEQALAFQLKWKEYVAQCSKITNPNLIELDEKKRRTSGLMLYYRRGIVEAKEPYYEIYRTPAIPVENAVKNTLELYVDTTTICSYNKVNKGYPFKIANYSQVPVKFTTIDYHLQIVAEVFYKKKWQEIEVIPISDCGNSYFSVMLDPKNEWNLMVPKYTGPIKAKMRYKLTLGKDNFVYSNEFETSFNTEQFVPKDYYENVFK